ncbi:GNAT family N-acetyltransferase [Catenuloplanes sp. NPDC051500]|uniref:GNAT family N-acetyltransferase n=1 Tax=Catenuloplanes sp. NPDC051500 TaxID=3363959 RepID=UPI00378B350D
MSSVLDNPAWASLAGPHAHLAERIGGAARYPADVGPHHALADPADPSAWADLAALVGPGATIMLGGAGIAPPPGWEHTASIGGVQLCDVSVRAAPDPAAVLLGPADVPEMLDLVARTQPGPFRTRTIAFGAYLGLRDGGRLVAMAGERLHPPGWTEISAVCTDPAYRGQGLATRLIRAVAAGIRARGETPFLHASATNTMAIRLYEQLGFALRIRTTFNQVTSPAVREATRLPVV